MNNVKTTIDEASRELENIACQIKLLVLLIGPVAIGLNNMPSKDALDSALIGITDHIQRIVNDLDSIKFDPEPDFSMLDSVAKAMEAETTAKAERCSGVKVVPASAPGKCAGRNKPAS